MTVDEFLYNYDSNILNLTSQEYDSIIDGKFGEYLGTYNEKNFGMCNKMHTRFKVGQRYFDLTWIDGFGSQYMTDWYVICEVVPICCNSVTWLMR